MAVDYFMKIKDIPGESQQDGHAGEIEVMSWSWSESNMGSAASGGGQGSGKVSMNDFTFSMSINKSSPKLLKACADGTHIGDATLTCRRAGKEQRAYLTIKFTDCLVSSFQTGGGGSEVPIDSVTMNFSKIEYSYSPQKSDGTLDTAIPVGYDLKTGKTS